MSLLVDPPFSLSQTLGVGAGEGTSWAGAVKQFPDVDPVTGKVRSARVKTCIAVRNVANHVLLPKRAVAWKVGSFTEVDGYVDVSDELVAGIVDEFIPASGVAKDDIFWITVSGPTEVRLGTGITAALGAPLVALTGATTGVAGFAQTGAATFLQNGYIGRAASTGAAGADVLAIVSLVRS